jgi:hypothetical protein
MTIKTSDQETTPKLWNLSSLSIPNTPLSLADWINKSTKAGWQKTRYLRSSRAPDVSQDSVSTKPQKSSGTESNIRSTLFSSKSPKKDCVSYPSSQMTFATTLLASSGCTTLLFRWTWARCSPFRGRSILYSLPMFSDNYDAVNRLCFLRLQVDFAERLDRLFHSLWVFSWSLAWIVIIRIVVPMLLPPPLAVKSPRSLHNSTVVNLKALVKVSKSKRTIFYRTSSNKCFFARILRNKSSTNHWRKLLFGGQARIWSAEPGCSLGRLYDSYAAQSCEFRQENI